MGILNRNTDSPEIRVIKANAIASELRQELAICKRDRDAYLAQLEGRKDLMWWIQVKSHRQRDALDDLNRRVTTLRFALKVHDSLHGPLTRDQWAAARDALSNEAHRERIDADVPA